MKDYATINHADQITQSDFNLTEGSRYGLGAMKKTVIRSSDVPQLLRFPAEGGRVASVLGEELGGQ